jgi:hypothetical protein
MPLDMHTMSTVNVTVTAMLGIVLVFTWARERECPFVGWWGLALLIQVGAVILAAASSTPDAGDLLAIGTAALILGDALKWKASRQFAGRRAHLYWTCWVRSDSCWSRYWAISNPSTIGLAPSAPFWRCTISPPAPSLLGPMARGSPRAGLP